MKPCSLLLFTALLLVNFAPWTAAWGESATSELPEGYVSDDIARVIEDGKLTVAMYYEDYIPFFVKMDDGGLRGLDIQLSEGIAASLGVEVEFLRTATTFDQIIDQVASGEAELAISYISRIMERGRKIGYSRPYLTLHPTLLINRLKLIRLKPGENPLPELKKKGVKIGVERAAAYEYFARQQFPQAEIIMYENFDLIIEDLLTNELHAGYTDEVEVMLSLNENPRYAINLGSYVIEDMQDQIAVVTPWDRHHLRFYVDLYLETNLIDYTLDDLRVMFPEWLGRGAHGGSGGAHAESSGGHGADSHGSADGHAVSGDNALDHNGHGASDNSHGSDDGHH